MYYEAALGLDRANLATCIAQKLITFNPSVNTYLSLVRHAQRAERPDSVEDVLFIAKAGLSDSDIKRLRQLSENRLAGIE